MEYNIETILEMYEDDYNPSSKVLGPRNMADGGRMEVGRGLKVLDKTENLKDTLCDVYAELDAMHEEKETIYFR